MSGLRDWFADRSLREKRLLVVMAVLLVVTLVWVAIIRPLGDGLSSARERHADAVERLGATESAIDALKAAQRSRARPFDGALIDAVRGEASEAGFALASLDPEGDARVHATIQSAKAGALTQWLARLERRGILTDRATMRDNGDQTVGADIVLKRRAG